MTMVAELGEVCAIRATNRKVLVDAINTQVDSKAFTGEANSVYLRVELSDETRGCEGGSRDYQTEADVPEHSVPCPCGNPRHWLIKYDEE